MNQKIDKANIFIQSDTKKITLIDLIYDSESKMRLGLKEVEERVRKESKDIKNNAPLTIEEKMFTAF